MKQKMSQEEIHNYQRLVNQIYFNLSMYIRDVDLTKELIDLYKDNLGEIIYEKESIELTNKIGGLIKNTRFLVFGNSINNPDIFEDDIYGVCTTKEKSAFKIMDVIEENQKTLIILLHMSFDAAPYFDKLVTNIDKEYIEKGKIKFNEWLRLEHLNIFNDEWYSKYNIPIGINGDKFVTREEVI